MGTSKGYAFFEYIDESVTDSACTGLNGMKLGDKTLLVQRAQLGARSKDLPAITASSLPSTNPLLTATLLGMPLMGSTSPPPPTHTILLLNMATSDELLREDEYQTLMADVREECGKLGLVKAVVIPKTDSSPLARVYVQYTCKGDAQSAHQNLGGRRYNGRSIVSHFVEDDMLKL